MSDQESPIVDGYTSDLSWRSFFIEMYFNETPLSSGTCCFVMSKSGPTLITNRHNFTGRNNLTGKPLHSKAGIPNNAVIIFPGIKERKYHIDLFDHQDPQQSVWVEHPSLGEKADIVALAMKETKNIIAKNECIDLDEDWHKAVVGTDVQVVGFAFGAISWPFPIWLKGCIASEPAIPFSQLPVFLIDCRARTGMSGSPVFVQHRTGDIIRHGEKIFQAKEDSSNFVGIYSGRIRGDSDLGMVWNKQCVKELIDYTDEVGVQHRMEKSRHNFKVKRSKNPRLE